MPQRSVLERSPSCTAFSQAELDRIDSLSDDLNTPMEAANLQPLKASTFQS